MNILKSKKAFITIVFTCTIIFYNSFSLYGLDLNSKNEIVIVKSDSTKTLDSQTQNSKEKKKEAKNAKPTTNLTYNIIYYLISKFIKTNPVFRPR